MKSFKFIISTIALTIAGGLVLAGCSANISIWAIVLGYLLASGAAFTLTGCGDEPEIITNPVMEDLDGDGFDGEWGGDDCDDTDPLIYPGATEDCLDNKDNDCDGQVDFEDSDCDDIVTNPAPEDFDEDGFTEDVDCNDDDENINPEAQEDCFDGIDNDCDNNIDEADEDCPEVIVNPAPEDSDGDGFYEWEDCNDDDENINPDAAEDCFDGIDNNCNQLIDDADPECAEIIVNPGPEDNDGDGFYEWEDCNDLDENINPDAAENCFDGIDNDCDQNIDDADDECPEVIVNPAPEDSDGDGFYEWEDCNDTDENINPGAQEDCFDGIDNNCNQLIDDADPECADIVTNPMPEDF